MKTIPEMARELGRSNSYIWRLVKVFALEPHGFRGKAGLYDFEQFKQMYYAGAYFV
jgi:hypothetical protein